MTNIITQSQMVVGRVRLTKPVQIGFDGDDYLQLKTEAITYKWTTVAYDKIERSHSDEIVVIDAVSDGMRKKVDILRGQLSASGLSGCFNKASEDGGYLAVGYDSGFIQVWNVLSQTCIANLSLSDTQMATISFTSDGKWAALGSGGRLVQIWNIEERKYVRTLYFNSRVSQVRFPANGKYLECQFSDGKYRKVNLSDGTIGDEMKSTGSIILSRKLLRSIDINDYKEIDSTPNGNAILLDKKGNAYTWDEKGRTLSGCPGHKSRVSAVAICKADERFAASYSGERYKADRDDGYRRVYLDGQKLVRIRVVKTGQCMWRLSTNGRDIRKLQFFTLNRIVLAGLATNGDILLWELKNRYVYGREQGHWDELEIVKNSQAEPLECAVPLDRQYFISAYTDGSILLRSFERNEGVTIRTLPGIDAGVLRWNDLFCDDGLKEVLASYKQAG